MLDILIKYHDKDLPRIKKIEQGDWIDLHAAEDIKLTPGSYHVISLGVSMKLPDGYEAHVAPRSSTFRNWGILQTNSIGVIDNSYCGDRDLWCMPVYATREAEIHKGDRICQFRVVKKMDAVSFKETEHLSDNNRGGFGSTGVA